MSALAGFVYFLRAGDFVKIGWSQNPRKRIQSFTTGNPHKAELLGSVPGTLEDEKRLHAVFGDIRHRREWFSAESELLGFIAWVCGVTAEKVQENVIALEARASQSAFEALQRTAAETYRADQAEKVAAGLRASRDYKKKRAGEFSTQVCTLLTQIRAAVDSHIAEIHRAIDATDDHDGLADALRAEARALYHVMEGSRPGASNSPLFGVWADLAYLAGDITREDGTVEEDDVAPL